MTVVRKTFGSCCSGESDPICIPGRRAAGWFGVDPPHLRWTRRVGVRCAGVGEGLAVVGVLPLVRSVAPGRSGPRSNLPAPAGCCASKSTSAERARAVRLARTGPGPVVMVLRGPLSMARGRVEQQGGPESTWSFRVRDGRVGPAGSGT